MHEAAFANAALPAPAFVLGLELRPYSIGHEVFLIAANNPILLGRIVTHRQLAEAVLICSQTFAEAKAMKYDRLIGLKIRLWKWRVRKLDKFSELAAFHAYRAAGSDGFQCKPPPNKGYATRAPGSPFLLRLYQFVATRLGEGPVNAWDYPLSLAKMQWAAFMEGEGALEVYNQHDFVFDEYCAEQDAKEALEIAKAKEAKCRV